jgi:formate-dependent nitrite reductase cytochrome c552 subunit
LSAGFQAFGVGKGAICMTCHNSRRGLRNDDTFAATKAAGEASRAPHGSSQTDVLMGENAYLVNVGVRGNHSLVTDTCVDCHMDQTSPPDLLAYNLGGTNHTFFASASICANCHEEITAESVQSAFQANSGQLQSLMEQALLNLIAQLTEGGAVIDLNGEATITDVDEIADLVFGETRGRQAITVTLINGEMFGPLRVNDVRVIDGGVDMGELYDFADDRLIKAGWNYNLANNDGSQAIHGPTFTFEYLDAAIDALNQLALE